MSYYPIFLDIRNKRCVVVGGGAVARRKVSMLLDHGAKVTVISEDFCPALNEMAGKGIVTKAQRAYQSGDLAGAFVAIAATDSEQTNAHVAQEASERGILINVVDVPSLSNFIVPSYLRRGDLTIAVSTNGKSPALSRRIRRKLDDDFGNEYAELTALVEEVRAELKGTNVSGDKWQEALELDSLLNLLRSGKRDEARVELLKALREGN